MKVITEPTVTVVAKTQFLGHPQYKIPSDGDSAIKLCAFAAKGCYDSYGEKGRANSENQSSILEHRHGSVLEHYNITVYIEGISRALSLELNRHRTLSISQRSTRYTKEDDAAIVLEPYYADIWDTYDLSWDESTHKLILPKEHATFAATDGGMTLLQTLPKDLAIMYEYIYDCDKSIEAYVKQVDKLMALNPFNLRGFELRKWARGKARNILPHSVETRATYTANIRAWRWIIESRSESHAEPEIRRLAHFLLKELRATCPFYFEDFKLVSTASHHLPEYKPLHSKV